MTDEGGTPMSRQRLLGFARDAAALGDIGVAWGFNIAKFATSTGFGVASACIKAPASAIEHTVGANFVSAGLRGADAVVCAAGTATRYGQEVAQTLTHASLGVAKRGLQSAGAQDGELLRLALGDEAGDAVATVEALARQLARPMAEVPLTELLAAARAWGAMQRAARSEAGAGFADSPARLPENAERWMRFSAATFGSEFLAGLVEGLSLTAAQRARVEGSRRGPAGAALACAGIDGDIEALAFEQGRSGLFAPGYMVAVDRSTNCVVVALRGTASARDALADLVCKPVLVEIGGESGEAHDGMLRAARGLEAKLAELASEGLGRLAGSAPQVVLCGHSLGAGVAALTAALWRDIGRLPGVHVRCVAFACPQILDARLAVSMSNFTTSIILQDDMVPRLSLSAATGLQEALVCVANPRACGLDMEPMAEQAAVWEQDADTGTLVAAHAAVKSAISHPEGQLRPAGRLLHIRAPSSQGELRGRVREASIDDFDELLLTWDMAGAHMPQRYLSAVREVESAATSAL